MIFEGSFNFFEIHFEIKIKIKIIKILLAHSGGRNFDCTQSTCRGHFRRQEVGGYVTRKVIRVGSPAKLVCAIDKKSAYRH